MQSVFVWNFKMVCLALVLGVCSVAPAQALSIWNNAELYTEDEKGNVWLDFSVSAGGKSLTDIWDITGDASFRLATQLEVEGLLAEAGLASIISYLGRTNDAANYQQIWANYQSGQSFFTIYQSIGLSISEYLPAVDDLNIYASWVVRKKIEGVQPVPEPGTFVLLVAGLIGLITLNRKAFRRKPR